MKAQKAISLELQTWEIMEREAGRRGVSSRIEQLIQLGRVKEKELKDRDEKVRKKELLEIGKQS